ncbi:MAG: M48 family metallopeptidase [Oligoflexales bacterium]
MRCVIKRIYVFTTTLALFIAACVTTPETDRKQVIVVSDEQMSALGEQSYREIMTKEKLSTDQKLKNEVTEIGKQIAQVSGKKYDWEFNVFESKDVNAFCLPGGKVGVFTGIVPVAKTTAGLAAVIGHEVAHAIARHGAERISQAMILQGLLVTTDVVLQKKEYRNMVLSALGLGAQLGVLLPYSRKHESEADYIGLKYMAEAGYDPNEAAELWVRMGEMQKSSPPEFLSTHPSSDRRAANLRAQVKEVWPLYEKSQKRPTVAL